VNVSFKERFARDLSAVKDKSLMRRVKLIIEEFERAQRPDEIAGLKKLKGGGNYYRLRVGDYRVGLKLVGDSVTFMRFLDRKEIYRYFP
jgi:mRNA interferase RelE/StbE